MRLVSPNDILKAAKKTMLEGRDPESKQDWGKIMNFVAYNVDKTCCIAICRLFRQIYSVPLTDDEVTAIAIYQGGQNDRIQA